VNVLIDAGPIIAFFTANDRWHVRVNNFFGQFTGMFITTYPVLTESLWQLRDVRVREKLLSYTISGKVFKLEQLTSTDLQRIKQLVVKYSDNNPDFADLSLIAVSERLNIPRIYTIDEEFTTLYRRFRTGRFDRVGDV